MYRMTMPRVSSPKLFSKITEAVEQGLEIFEVFFVKDIVIYVTPQVFIFRSTTSMDLST
jgi:hypothetical protein